jgi:hypothetical protein
VKIATFAKPENVSINHPFSITTLSPTAWHIAIFHTSRIGLPKGIMIPKQKLGFHQKKGK